jgi:hypothetical protein
MSQYCLADNFRHYSREACGLPHHLCGRRLPCWARPWDGAQPRRLIPCTQEHARQRADQVAIMTGAARGIGRAAARCLAEEGAQEAAAEMESRGRRALVGPPAASGGKFTVSPPDINEPRKNKCLGVLKSMGSRAFHIPQ